MPARHCIIHKIDKKPDGTPAVLHLAGADIAESQARDDLLSQFNETYNATSGKVWGFFHYESGAHPFSGWLGNYLAGASDFLGFTTTAVEHLTKLMEESNLTIGGHALFCHYQQGMTEYLIIGLAQETDAVAMTDSLELKLVRRLDLDRLHLAARINISEWQNNPKSRQYISLIQAKKGRRASEYFRDFIGCQEGVDGPGETRTLLKAFSDFVESEDLCEESAREKTAALVDYATAQNKMGEPVSLDELSERIDEDNPKTFADFIRDKDYGLSPTIPADKKTINRFRRFTGRAEGLSISFESHLLGDKIKFDENAGTLLLSGLPKPLTDQLKRTA
jgi:nucleoid-associated protein